MRSKTTSNITLRYPDEIGFAFNASIFIAEGINIASMRIEMTDEAGASNKFTCMAFKDGCYVDIQEYVQSYYESLVLGDIDYINAIDTKVGKNLLVKAFVILADNTEVEFDTNIYYIWGAMKLEGETYNGHRALTWFRNFPFTVGIFATSGSLSVMSEGVVVRDIQTAEKGVYNIPMLITDDKDAYVIEDISGTATGEITFDSTFDMTFHAGTVNTEKIKINVVDEYDEGCYLRWIDRHGFYCYYLFKSVDSSIQVTASSTFQRNDIVAHSSNGYRIYTGSYQVAQSQTTIPICAPLVNSETFDMLLDIATSPCVDLFAGYVSNVPRWVNVNIQVGTYKKDNVTLQDFICNMIMPEVPIQKL